jgi:PTS system mannitol-specific IIA component
MTDQRTLGDLLDESSIVLDATVGDRDDAIRRAGELLVAAGAVDATYIDGMLDRERSVSTYVGEGVAVPHGTRASGDSVHRDAISVLRLAEGVDWNGETVHVVVGLAARGLGHVAVLAQLATVLLEPENAEALRSASTAAEISAVLGEPTPDQHPAPDQ